MSFPCFSRIILPFLRPRYEDWKPPKTHTIIETEKARLKDPTTVTAEFFGISSCQNW